MKKESKDVPVLYRTKEECCGCSACMAVCPLANNGQPGAIEMVPDEEGFIYPVIDSERCVRCQKCVQICPCNNKKEE